LKILRFAAQFKSTVPIPDRTYLLENPRKLKEFLDFEADRFNEPGFIPSDPVSIPHRFSKKEDIEISGLIAALFAWGQRTTILKKSTEILERMSNDPHHFVLFHSDKDIKAISDFKHRTFNGTDALYLIYFLKRIYTQGNGMESAFFPNRDESLDAVLHGLVRFRKLFTEDSFYQKRSGKHISSPESGSACKRLNMFLRWMVRKDDKGVDFGIWNSISPAQLICPCDLHVERNARQLGLVTRPVTDWKMAIELTENLRLLDPLDPVKYDFALFGLGIESKSDRIIPGKNNIR
jgi:uncharacterized protein (TIGR02757 family)